MTTQKSRRADPDEFIQSAMSCVELLGESLERMTESKDRSSFEHFQEHSELLRERAQSFGSGRIEALARVGGELCRSVREEMDINVLLSVQSLLYQLLRETERELKFLKSGPAPAREQDQHLLTKLKAAIAALGDLPVLE